MENKELKRFGLILGTVLTLWGGWKLYRNSPAAIVFLTLALTVSLLGLFYPQGLKPVETFLKKLESILAWLMTRLVLILIFYLVILPTGWLLKLSGKDLLQLKSKKELASYWLPAAGRLDKKQLTKQY